MSRFRPFSFPSSAAISVAIAWLALVAARDATRLVAQEAAAAPEPVVREALGSGAPLAAPGQQLQLVRYVIQPGTTLPPHTHPGMQIAWIESGTMHYVLVGGGETPVYRKGRAGRRGAVEMLGPGEETDVHPGDTLIEAEHVIHYGANLGDDPVVIWAAVLLQEGQPPAVIAETPTP